MLAQGHVSARAVSSMMSKLAPAFWSDLKQLLGSGVWAGSADWERRRGRGGGGGGWGQAHGNAKGSGGAGGVAPGFT